MNTRTLQAFLVLADLLHFARAAEACHMSPSTLSRIVRQLEDDLGTPLLLRDNRSVALTPAGERFRRYARDALTLWESFERSVQADSDRLRGTLTLFGSVTASYSFLFDVLARLHQQHPDIRIALQTGDPEQAVARVQSGESQIAMGARPEPLPSAIVAKAVATTPLVFIAARDSAAADALHGRPTAPTAWRDVAVILPQRGVARERTLRWLRQRRLTPEIAAQVAGNEAIVSMVSLGAGVGVVPRIVLDNSPLADRVTVLPAGTNLEPLVVSLFALRKNLGNPLIAALWDASDAAKAADTG